MAELRNALDKEDVIAKERKGVYLAPWQLVLVVAIGLATVVAAGLVTASFWPHLNISPEIVETTETTEISEDRLTKNVIPMNYEVELQPFLIPENFTFVGKIKVKVRIVNATKIIKLHAKNLEIFSINVTDFTKPGKGHPNGSSLGVEGIVHSRAHEYLEIHLNDSLVSGAIVYVLMEFSGELASKLSGLSLSSYTRNGSTRWLAATLLQPTGARQTFPCFDEPGFKATFALTIVRWKNMTSLSNMPYVTQINRGEDFVADVYRSTPRISTHAVAFVVCDFEYIGNREHSLGVWSRPEATRLARHALEVAPPVMSYFESKLQVPLPPLEIVAIPGFATRAAESWGLMMYRESSLLVDPNRSSLSELYDLSLSIAHELSHVWFGNLVTPAWWSDLWLSEGFATHLAHSCLGELHPDWRVDEHFVAGVMQDVLRVDALSSSTPVSRPVSGRTSEIRALYGPIVDAKGASLVRMMRAFLGKEDFEAGIVEYLKTFAYGNARQDDLWKVMDQSQTGDRKVDVKQVMDSWTLQPGYPLIRLERNYGEGTGRITQERFLLENNADAKSSVRLWAVPVTVANSQNPQGLDLRERNMQWLTEETGSLDNLPDSDHWVVLNHQQFGFYRVDYDPRNWALLYTALLHQPPTIHVINRAQILDDAFALASAGRRSYRIPLMLAGFLRHEEEYAPWMSASRSFRHLTTLLSGTDAYGSWKRYVLEAVTWNYHRLEWETPEDEPATTQQLRELIYTWACRMDSSECVGNARKIFDLWIENSEKNSSAINPNLRKAIYCTGVRDANESDWKKVWDRYAKEDVVVEKNALMYGLCCSEDKGILSALLNRTLEPSSGIPRQDASRVFSMIASNDYGGEPALAYLKNRWDEIYEAFGNSTFTLASMMQAVGAKVNSKAGLEELKALGKRSKMSDKTFSQALEMAEANVRWMDHNLETVSEFLKEDAPPVKNVEEILELFKQKLTAE